MARLQPRSNIFTLLPILAVVIMAAGITLTWIRIHEYQQPAKPTKLPPAPIRQYPDLPAVKKAEEPPPAETAKAAEEAAPGEGEKEKAPAEGEKEKAPEVKEKAPEEEPKTAPKKKAVEEEEK